MPVKRQTGFGAQRIARPQTNRLHASDLPDVEQILEQGCSLIRVDEQLEGHLLPGIAGARDDQIEAAYHSIAQLGALEGHDPAAGFIVAAQRQQDLARPVDPARQYLRAYPRLLLDRAGCAAPPGDHTPLPMGGGYPPAPSRS